MKENFSKQDLVSKIQEVFKNYYVFLVQEIEQSLDGTSDYDVKKGIIRIENKFNKFWSFSEMESNSNREVYFKKIQERLRSEGFYLDITPQYGIDTGKLNLETVDNVSLRPIISRGEKQLKIGNQQIKYTESILGESLIGLPHFIEPIVEAASPTEIVIFPSDLYKALEDDYSVFKDYGEEAERRFQPGVQTSDNLFCVNMKLYARQWDSKVPSEEALNTLMDLFRLHGQQHVLDFGLLNSGQLHFISEDAALSESLNKDSILEARVMVRQLLEKSAPYYVLGQIISYEREWLGGSRSEYAWAGHLLFEKLSNKWTLGIEKMDKDEIYSLASQFAQGNKNFTDMLTVEQVKEVHHP